MRRFVRPHSGRTGEGERGREKLKARRAASPRRNEGVTGNENPGCLSSSSSSSSSEIEYDDEDEPSRQLEVMDEEKGVDARYQGQREASVWVCGCVGVWVRAAPFSFQLFSFSLQRGRRRYPLRAFPVPLRAAPFSFQLFSFSLQRGRRRYPLRAFPVPLRAAPFSFQLFSISAFLFSLGLHVA
jgi:hypothetical protein